MLQFFDNGKFVINRADVLGENTEAVFATYDPTHGIWAEDFLQIYNVSRIWYLNTEGKFSSDFPQL